ncbi:MAG: hypothetical protein H8F28_24260 [Fibrella sp.]|nr:hypothetical protein [Armatimonadota bacterium]
MSLHLQLFGAPSIEVNGVPMSLRHRRAVLVFALLVLRGGRPLSRQVLSDSIWHDHDPDAASVSLRRALADLRTLLGPEAYRVSSTDRRELGLDITDDFACDLLAFDASTHRFERDGDLAAATVATDLYRGPLLEGWSDECLEPERRHRRESVAVMLEALARKALHDQREPSEVLRLCDRAEATDPYRETTLRLRVEAHLSQNDHAAAEAAFRTFTRRLDQDLGVAPSAQTLDLATAIPRTVAPDRPERTEPSADFSSGMEFLPTNPGTLIGRQDEINRLVERALSHPVQEPIPRPFLTTITGPGGVGKTRFALATTRQWAAHSDASKVVFVDLSCLPTNSPSSAIYRTIATSLAAHQPEMRDTSANVEGMVHELLRCFALPQGRQGIPAPTLLLLDNAEHLLPALTFVVADLLRLPSSSLWIMATSRTLLNLGDETLLSLPPLPVPVGDSVADVNESESGRLFVARASSVQGSFRLDESTAPKIANLCRRLDGLPLAVELAASRLRTLTLTELETQLCGTEDLPLPLLSGGSVTTPKRQRTVMDTVAWSWSLLSRDQKTLLARLSLFRGGWTLEAAEAVVKFPPLPAQESLIAMISDLVDHSLVQMEDQKSNVLPRYRLLETVRSFAATRLNNEHDSDVQADTVRRRLADWAVAFAENAYQGLWGMDARSWVARIGAEESNLRAGLETADAPTAQRIVRGIEPIWWRSGRFYEGLSWQEIAAVKAEQSGDSDAALPTRLTQALFRRNLGEPHQARALFARAIKGARERGGTENLIYLLHSLGFLQRDDGELKLAAATQTEGVILAEEFARQTGEALLLAYQWRGLAAVEVARGNYTEAEALCNHAIERFHGAGNAVQEMMTLPWLGRALIGQGDVTAGYAFFAAALSLAHNHASVQIEQEAEQGMSDAMLASGDYVAAVEHLDSAHRLAVSLGSHEGIALADCTKSALARKTGQSNPRICARTLFDPTVTRLPYPTFLRVLEEAGKAADASDLPGIARRLRAETEHACDASHDGAGGWSPRLNTTRVRAAYPPDWERSLAKHGTHFIP